MKSTPGSCLLSKLSIEKLIKESTKYFGKMQKLGTIVLQLQKLKDAITLLRIFATFWKNLSLNRKQQKLKQYFQ